MKRTLLIIALAAAASVSALDDQSEQAQKLLQRQTGIKLNHWVLAKPNGQPITTLDIARRLEMAFYQNYPEYSSHQQARLQFYQSAWKQLLVEQIDNQLILADAEDKKIKVSDADVRQELESLFGPNVVETLDEMGIGYHEAWEMTRDDLIVQQMRGYMMQSKAAIAITPERLRQRYDRFVEEYELNDLCEYQVLTLRHNNAELARKAAERANALVAQGKSLQQVYDLLSDARQKGDLAPSITMRLAETEKRPVNTLATSYREALDGLSAGTTSAAIEQTSRDGSTAYRLFYLASLEEDHIPTFDEVVDQMRGEIFQNAYIDAQQDYIGRLHQRYDINEEYLAAMIPSEFTPFTL